MRHLTLALLLLVSGSAHAARYAILVGNNLGRGMDAPLRFAESDAQKLSRVLVELGGFEAARTQILFSPTADKVEGAFRAVAGEIERTHDGSAFVLFYYSGHADGATLHLGESSLDLFRVRELLNQTAASVRIGVLDACGAGALTVREKGVEKGSPFMVSAPPELAQRGQVIIAAVSASESAQESDAIKGSFFTNYLVAGLRGAADRSGTGRVTLDDAYRYAYAQTVRATMLSRAGAQHPTYAVNLSGQGDLVLTEPRHARSRLVFRSETSGEFAIFTPTEELVAEVAVGRSAEVLFALTPGEYEIRKRSPDGLRIARVRISDGDERALDENRMQSLDYVRLARKGFNPRLRIAVGYNWGSFASPYGGLMGHLSVDLAARHVIVSPRITAGITGWSAGSPPDVVGVGESFVGGGLALAYPWERARWFLALGGGVDLGAIWQEALGRSQIAFAFNVSLQGTVGLRLYRGLSVALDLEPGLLFPRTDAGLVTRPNYNVLLGVRYDL
jgi:hypothetical protein